MIAHVCNVLAVLLFCGGMLALCVAGSQGDR